MKRGEDHAREEGERYGREEEEAISEAGAGGGSMDEAGANKAILNIRQGKQGHPKHPARWRAGTARKHAQPN